MSETVASTLVDVLEMASSRYLASLPICLVSMAHAIGAPGRQVISIAGDGRFTTFMGDCLPLKVVVFHCNALSLVEIEQNSAGLLDFDTDQESKFLRSG